MKKEQTINLNEETVTIEQQKNDVQNPSIKQKKSGTWKSVLIGGVPGIILGTAGTAFAQEVVSSETQDAEDAATTGTSAGAEHMDTQNIDAKMAESVNDDMSFNEAFAAARTEVGPGGVFEWHGNLYSTYTSSEWNSMSDEDRQTFAESASGHSHADDSDAEGPREEDSQDVPADENAGEEEEPQGEDSQDFPEDENVEGEDANDGNQEISEVPEIEIHEIQSVSTENGEIVNVAIASVDNHDAQFVDVDNDGYVDGVAIDANDDGTFQDTEIISTPDSGVVRIIRSILIQRVFRIV